MNVPLATEEETQRFLQILWFDFGVRLVRSIAQSYNLSEEQTQALEEVLLKPNDWKINIKPLFA